MSKSEKLNILLVDDQPAKLLSYEVILGDLGENLVKAQSGAEALEYLLRNEVAVVLIDVCMPELDGFELAAMIREHPRSEKTAVIFISAIHFAEMDRLRGYELGAVDYVPVPVVPQVLRAKVKVFTELYRKTRQLERFNLELEQRVTARTAELKSYASRLSESERRRTLALAASNMGSWDWDVSTGECIWDEGQFRIFGVEPNTFKVTPERIRALLEPDDWFRLNDVLQSVSPDSATYETEFRVRRPNGDTRWCLARAAATFDSDDRISRISGVTVDITDQKQAQSRQLLLTREVEHRARNLLAVVQSMLRLTKATSVDDYIAALQGRIGALSRAHMLLSEHRWEGAFLRRLVDEELNHYRDGGNAISAEGPELLLEASRAQTIALALHELATNAAKHGALTGPLGCLHLVWKQKAETLWLDWTEMGGPQVCEPTSFGYGLEVIGASIEQLGGHVDFEWKPEGVHCTLSLPLTEQRTRSKGQHIRDSEDMSAVWEQFL